MATNKSWSIKGIDPDARDAVKAAAKDAGMTVAEWLNHAIAENRLQAMTDGVQTDAPKDKDMVRRLEDTERRTTLAITGIDQSVAGVTARLKAAEEQVNTLKDTQAAELASLKKDTSSSVKSLEKAHKDAASRLADLEKRSEETAAAHEHKSASLDEALATLSKRLDGAQEVLFTKLDTAIERAELRQEKSADELRRQVQDGARLNESTLGQLKSQVEDMGSRLSRAENLTDNSLKALRASLEDASSRMDGFEGALGDIDRLSLELSDIVKSARQDIARELEEAIVKPGMADVKTALSHAEERIRKTELQQAEGLKRINLHIANLATAVDEQLQLHEQTFARADRVEELGYRLEDLEARAADAARVTSDELVRANKNLAARISNIEVSSAKALDDIGSRVVKITEEISGQNENSRSGIASQLSEMETRTREAVEESHADILQRFESFADDQNNQLAHVQRSIATLTARLEAVEGGAMAQMSHAPADVPPPFPDEEGDSAYAPAPEQPRASAVEPPAQNVVPFAGPEAGKAVPYDPANYGQATAYQDNPYGAGYGDGTYGAQPQPQPSYYEGPAPMPNYQPAPQENPYATPDVQELPESLANARPGAVDSKKKKKAKKPKPEKAEGTGGIRKTLIMGVGIAALAAMGAFVVKDRFLSADPQPPQSQLGPAMSNPAGDNPANPTEPDSAVPGGEDGAMGMTALPFDIEDENADDAVVTPPAKADPGIQASPDMDLSTIQSAAAAGHPVAQYQMGIAELQNGRTAEAVRLIRLSANQGLAISQYRLAKMYEMGEGVDQNETQARKLLETSANAGNLVAMHELAMYHAAGAGGLEPDMENAARWFQKAAESGLIDSQYNMGYLYETGDGVPQSLPDAFVWYGIAARQGDQEAGQRALELAQNMSPEQISEGEARVNNFMPKRTSEQANGIFKDMPWGSPAASAQSVKRAQTLLNTLGYDVGTPDGAMGPKTSQAIMAYERDHGLPQTGKVDATLLQRLEMAAAG